MTGGDKIRELRKKTMKLRTRAIYEPRADLRDRYQAMAKLYDLLAVALASHAHAPALAGTHGHARDEGVHLISQPRSTDP
jgi:hypothetical protein